ncbi:AraC family transcriptional regulator [Maridesulfovibrio zosterae]|uniref:AraC family transcriptional regulator n=1 Tax=Maridesulfovibrio zosterae TaxID=82171 RepID=UPI00041C021B|nr:AraC family transcriptional regulator [Maridesulfovibrio zosterae]
MREFNYYTSNDITLLSAKFDEFKYKKHAHEEYSIGVTLKGIQQWKLEGEQCQSKPGGIMLFNPDQIHDGCAGDEKGLEYVMTYIPTDLFKEISGKKDILRFSAPVVYDKKLAANIVSLAHSIETGQTELLTTELIMSVIDRTANADEKMRMPKSFTAVRRAIEMMHASYEHPLKLDEICNEIQMSKFHFIRQFKAIKGVSPYQFFLNGKIAHAKKLLDAKDELYDVMLKCGFYDLSHMNRLFKSVYGVTAFSYSQLVG